MIINGDNYGIGEKNAYYNYFIEISSKNNTKKFTLNFNEKDLPIDSIKIDEVIDLNDYLADELYLLDNNVNYLFFNNKKNKIDLKKLSELEYEINIDVIVNEDDRIFSADDTWALESLKCKTNIFFKMEKPEYELSEKIKNILNTDLKTPDNFFDVLDKI